MTQGGARSRSGPKPDVNALRRDREKDKAGWTRLPKDGCALDVPEWPAEFEAPSVREIALWHRLWKMPQAYVWHRDHCVDMVVVYVRASLQAGSPKAGPGILASFRQYSEALLLTPSSLLRERCYIEGSAEDYALNANPDAAPAPAPSAGTGSADVVRGRFRVIQPTEDEDDDADAPADTE